MAEKRISKVGKVAIVLAVIAGVLSLSRAIYNYAQHGESTDRLGLLDLRPSPSKATNLFHIYYVKKMSVNGICFADAIFVKDTASLREVAEGIDEPIPRVSSHELGHAFGLPHRQDTTNLMASGTTGTWLNDAEINQAREVARKFDWLEPAPEVLKRANALFRANKQPEAAAFYARLATIPLNAEEVELAKQRAVQATQPSSNATAK